MNMASQTRSTENLSRDGDYDLVQRTIKDMVERRLDHDQAARQLSPLLELAEDRTLGAQRLSCLFLHLEVGGAFAQFRDRFIGTKKNNPLPKPSVVYDLVNTHQKNDIMTARLAPAGATTADWDVNHWYAKLILAVNAARVPGYTKNPRDALNGAAANDNHLVSWVRGMNADHVFWVVFHAVMYLQLEAERENLPLGKRLIRRLTLKKRDD